MNWASRPIEELKEGQQAQCRPHGNSMRGRINSGQLVTLEPIVEDPDVDDAVLCRVRGNTYIHLVRAIKGHGEKKQFLIGNNRGGTNGWIGRNSLFGKVIKVED